MSVHVYFCLLPAGSQADLFGPVLHSCLRYFCLALLGKVCGQQLRLRVKLCPLPTAAALLEMVGAAQSAVDLGTVRAQKREQSALQRESLCEWWSLSCSVSERCTCGVEG